jgi:RND family efflux transporter MFP subunit
MNRRRPILVAGAIVIIVAAIAVIAFFLINHGTSARTTKVTRGSLEATIETVGQLQARDPVAVHSTLNGTVKLVAVKPGDVVQSGDVLVEIDRTPFDAAVQQAESQLANAETALNLAEMQAGSTPTAQQTATKLQADENVAAAKRELQQAQSQIASTLILAPANGTIIDVQTAAGTPVGQGTTVVNMADLSDLTLSVDIDEIDIPHVTKGMTATFRLDAYPGTTISGTLSDVSPIAQTSGGMTTFPATVTFKAPNGVVLRPGMNANVSIETAVRNNVLLIPQSALRTVGQRTFVTVVTNGKQTDREIQIGLSSGGEVEVASGLNEGDTVVLH